jgi:DNA-binding XRE family transcriptional regulator
MMDERPMTKTLADLVERVELEAREQGPKAELELETLRAFYRVARQIAARRAALRLTQQTLASKSGIRQSEISKIERGNANPTFATLSALAASLGREIALRPRRGPTDRPRRARS